MIRLLVHGFFLRTAFRHPSDHSRARKYFAVRSYSEAASTTSRARPAAAAASRFRAIQGGQEDRGGADRVEKVGNPMEVEVKLRLADEASYKKVEELIASGLKATYLQENYFFDGSAQELNSRRVVLRVRLYDTDKKARLTLKGEQILKDGIGSAPETEEPLEPNLARELVSTPSSLLQLDSPIMQGLVKQYGLKELVCLGGFKNMRKEASWRDHVLELDQTQYPWGTLYELECETGEPERLRSELEALLTGAGVSYSYSKTSKFANFINKTLL